MGIFWNLPSPSKYIDFSSYQFYNNLEFMTWCDVLSIHNHQAWILYVGPLKHLSSNQIIKLELSHFKQCNKLSCMHILSKWHATNIKSQTLSLLPSGIPCLPQF